MTTEHVDAGAGPLGLGATLARLREAKGWSLADVSERLKFSLRQVESLEAERFGELPVGPVLRGFVRNYARILETDAEPLLKQLDALSPAKPLRVEPAPSLAAPVPKLRPPRGAGSRSTGLFVGLVFGVLAVLAAAGWVTMSGHSWGEAPAAPPQSAATLASGAPASGAASSGPAAGSDAAGAAPAAAPGAGASPEHAPAHGDAPGTAGGANPPLAVDTPSVAQSSAPGAGVIPTAVQPGTPAAAASPADRQDAGLIRLKFKDASWVEVRQRDGRVLLSQLNPGDTEKTLAGEPPFKMVIGNAPAVQLEYKGNPVDLKPLTSRDNVARVTLN